MKRGIKEDDTVGSHDLSLSPRGSTIRSYHDSVESGSELSGLTLSVPLIRLRFSPPPQCNARRDSGIRQVARARRVFPYLHTNAEVRVRIHSFRSSLSRDRVVVAVNSREAGRR